MNGEQIQTRNKRQYEWQKKNTDRINILLPKGFKEAIKAYAKSAGMSASEWVTEAVKAKMLDQDSNSVESVTREEVEE